MNQVTYKGLSFKPFLPEEQIQKRVCEIAGEISCEYAGKVPLLICVLNGAFPFASDIFRSLSIDAEITFIRLKSYSGTESTGQVKEIAGILGITEHAVKKRLQRGREQFRTTWKEEYCR